MKKLFLLLIMLSFVAFSQTTLKYTFNTIKADSVKSGEIDTSATYVVDYSFNKIISIIVVDSLSASDSLSCQMQISNNGSYWVNYTTSGELCDTLVSETSDYWVCNNPTRYVRWIYTPKGTSVYAYYRHWVCVKD